MNTKKFDILLIIRIAIQYLSLSRILVLFNRMSKYPQHSVLNASFFESLFQI